MTPSSSIRTRFAPSPTGFAHVGNIRTGLFAFLVARQQNGTFILRLEDTDKNREVEGSDQHLMATLRALNVFYDEGPDVGGPHAPYRQSERLEIYQEWANKLIEAGRAYADPYSAEQIQEFREQAKAEKCPFLYRNHRPENPPKWDGELPLRFKSDPKPYNWHDEVMGDLSTGPEVIDDFILVKSDGYPTYNFAHIVDDAAMEVTHVIRGQEFISSMPNYLNLYDALGVARPIFATMPHIMAESGNKKLGKRDGAKDALEYLDDGFLPEALVNFIATLGWNDGTEQEIFTMEELIEKFSLDRVGRSGARFDVQRLTWLNGQHIRTLTLDDLYSRVEKFWPTSAANASQSYKKEILKLVQDRLKTLQDLPSLSSYFFEEPTIDWSLVDSNKQLKKLGKGDIFKLLETAEHELSRIENWNAENIQTTLNDLLEITGQKPGILFSLIRIATTWAPFSPQLNETLELLGKETVIRRMQQSLDGNQ